MKRWKQTHISCSCALEIQSSSTNSLIKKVEKVKRVTLEIKKGITIPV